MGGKCLLYFDGCSDEAISTEGNEEPIPKHVVDEVNKTAEWKVGFKLFGKQFRVFLEQPKDLFRKFFSS